MAASKKNVRLLRVRSMLLGIFLAILGGNCFLLLSVLGGGYAALLFYGGVVLIILAIAVFANGFEDEKKREAKEREEKTE